MKRYKNIDFGFRRFIFGVVCATVAAIVPVQSAFATDDIMVSIYNSLLGAYADMAYQFDPQIAFMIDSNKSMSDIVNQVGDDLKKIVDEETINAFAGIQAQNKRDVLMTGIKASDDVDINYAKTGIFGIAQDLIREAKDVESQKNNALFNVEYLIGTNVYKDDTEKQNALACLEQVKGIFPPPDVIRIGATFDVPMPNPDDPSQKTTTIGQKTPLTVREVDQLKDLQNDQDYRTYKRSYRSVVAVRNLFLDTLDQVYQVRVKKDDIGKSLEQIRDERAESRLKADYYQSMSTASPDTVNREILFVLSEISAQLNDIRKQNDRMMTMNAVAYMSQSAMLSASVSSSAQNVGKIIYCKIQANKESATCKNASEVPNVTPAPIQPSP